MVLKSGSDWPVWLSANHYSSLVRPIGPGSNRTRIGPFESAVRPVNRTNWLTPFEPNSSFSFSPSPCDWYPHCHLERRLAGNGTSPVAWSIILWETPPALGTPPRAKKPSQPRQHPMPTPNLAPKTLQILVANPPPAACKALSPHSRRRTGKLSPPPVTTKSPPTRSSPHLSLSLSPPPPTIGKPCLPF